MFKLEDLFEKQVDLITVKTKCVQLLDSETCVPVGLQTVSVSLFLCLCANVILLQQDKEFFL